MKLTPANRSTIDINDNLSDLIEIDMELTDAGIDSDTIDTTTTSFDDHVTETMTDITSESSTNDDLYNFIENRLLTLDPEMTMALGNMTYHTDFHPHYFPPDKEGNFGRTLYKKTPPNKETEAVGDELGLVFFGEICPSTHGTAISAKGNHYAGSPKYPKVSIIRYLTLAYKFHIFLADYRLIDRERYPCPSSINNSTSR